MELAGKKPVRSRLVGSSSGAGQQLELVEGW